MRGEGVAFALFDTDLGRCAIAWRGGLVISAALPEEDARLRAHMERRFGAKESEPPAFAERAIAAVQALLAGADPDMRPIEVDLTSLGAFDRAVLEAARLIPRGETRTYGEMAAALGAPGASRAVGRALGANPVPIIIPCHRVLGSAGKSGGFSAPGGATTKMRMLDIERARRGDASSLFDALPWAVKGS